MVRSTNWIDKTIAITITPATQSSTNITSTLSAAERKGTTLIRCLYRLSIRPTDLLDTHTVLNIFMGIGLIEGDAAAAGVLPDPEIEGDYPGRGWVVKDYGVCWSSAGTSGSSMVGMLRGDIRAMRKIHQTEELTVVYDVNLLSGTTQTMKVDGIIRTLWKDK